MINLTRWLYLRLLGLIHLSAFWSYAVIILGLNGEHGIAPTHALLQSVTEPGWQRFYEVPTVAWLNSSDSFLQGIAWLGMAASVLLSLGILSGPALILCLLLWLSLVAGGGEFTAFQSDGMLVEATFLTLFIVPWKLFEPPWPVPLKLKQQSTASPVGMWLLRFMIFRLMLAAGLVKILSGDTTWANFTALQYHFETQPIPTPLAWYANQLPHWFLKMNVAFMFMVELLCPCLVFAGRKARLVAAIGFAILHAGIILSGNYTFLNYLTIVLSLTLLDDDMVRRVLPARLCAAIEGATDMRSPSRLKQALLVGCATPMFIMAGTMLGATITGFRAVPNILKEPLLFVAPFHLCDRYGLFAVMTTERPEIVFQGSNDGEQWKTYEFRYKVSDDWKRPPPWVAPHMPRLDWRLWFAAMEPVAGNSWVLSLVEHMLAGDSAVLDFFSTNPFPDKPPRYIRAYVYNYHFTNYAQKNQSGDWWWRDNKQVYLPPLTLKEGALEEAVLPAQSQPAASP